MWKTRGRSQGRNVNARMNRSGDHSRSRTRAMAICTYCRDHGHVYQNHYDFECRRKVGNSSNFSRAPAPTTFTGQRMVCQLCDQLNHGAKDCPTRNASMMSTRSNQPNSNLRPTSPSYYPRNSRAEMAPDACFACGNPGHRARDCRERNQGNSPNSFTIADTPPQAMEPVDEPTPGAITAGPVSNQPNTESPLPKDNGSDDLLSSVVLKSVPLSVTDDQIAAALAVFGSVTKVRRLKGGKKKPTKTVFLTFAHLEPAKTTLRQGTLYINGWRIQAEEPNPDSWPMPPTVQHGGPNRAEKGTGPNCPRTMMKNAATSPLKRIVVDTASSPIKKSSKRKACPPLGSKRSKISQDEGENLDLAAKIRTHLNEDNTIRQGNKARLTQLLMDTTQAPDSTIGPAYHLLLDIAMANLETHPNGATICEQICERFAEKHDDISTTDGDHTTKGNDNVGLKNDTVGSENSIEKCGKLEQMLDPNMADARDKESNSEDSDDRPRYRRDKFSQHRTGDGDQSRRTTIDVRPG